MSSGGYIALFICRLIFFPFCQWYVNPVCEQAYTMAQNLDPNSDGRGVLQFKTGLMSVIKVMHVWFSLKSHEILVEWRRALISGTHVLFSFCPVSLYLIWNRSCKFTYCSKNLLKEMGLELIEIMMLSGYGIFIKNIRGDIGWMIFKERNKDTVNPELSVPTWESMSLQHICGSIQYYEPEWWQIKFIKLKLINDLVECCWTSNPIFMSYIYG